MSHWKTLTLLIVLAIAGWVLTMYALSALARKPSNLGLIEGRLAECPSTPNCVWSQAEDAQHAIDPFAIKGDPDEAWERLKVVVLAQPRTKIITERETYLHAEATSMIFRYVDDVEFLLDADEKVIHVRSASRVGRSDMGVNRHRVEEIRKAFESNP